MPFGGACSIITCSGSKLSLHSEDIISGSSRRGPHPFLAGRLWTFAKSCEIITLFQPKVVTDLDENEIKKRMELLELEGAEVPGDEEDNEEGMTAPAELDLQVEAEQRDKKPDAAGGEAGGEDEEEEGEEED